MTTRSSRSLKIVAIAIAIAAFLLSICLCTSPTRIAHADDPTVWDGVSVDTSWYDGHESETEFTISSAAALAGIQLLTYNGTTFEGKTIFLARDIDLNGCKDYAINEGTHTTYFNDTDTKTIWEPISGFCGTFDGQNHTISNMSVVEGNTNSKKRNRGFFAVLADVATVQNVLFQSAIVAGTSYVGVVAGKTNNGTVIQSVSVLNSRIFVSESYAGGIAGSSRGISSSLVYGLTIDCTNGGSSYLGGLVGTNENFVDLIAFDNSVVYDFAVVNCDSPTQSGLFSGGPQAVTLATCVTNSEFPLSTGEFEIVGAETVSYDISTPPDPTPAFQDDLDDYIAAVENMNTQNLVTSAESLYAQYLAIIDGKTQDELDYIADYIGDHNDYASEIVKSISFEGALTYGDQYATVTCTMIDGSTTNAQANVSFNSLHATLTFESTYSNTAYTLTTETDNVSKKPITIIVENQESEYGNSIITPSCHVKEGQQLVNGDNLQSVISLAKAGTSVQCGTYDITWQILNQGYNITIEGACVYKIVPRKITVRINDQTIQYGEAESVPSATIVSGSLVDGDELNSSLIAIAIDKEDFVHSVGEYDIVGECLNQNYDMTVEQGKFVISPRSITVSIADTSSIYGEQIGSNQATLVGGTLAYNENLASVISVSAPNSVGAGTYEITAQANSNYSATFEYTNGTHSIYKIEKLDVSAQLAFNIAEGASVLQGTAISCECSSSVAIITLAYTLDGQSVDNTNAVGDYTIVATVEDNNHKGSATLHFSTYENVYSKINEIASLIALYNDATASDEQRITALFSAQSIYANLSNSDKAQIEANENYQATINAFIECWNALKDGANEDLLVAEKAYDNTLIIVMTVVASLACASFVALKILIG